MPWRSGRAETARAFAVICPARNTSGPVPGKRDRPRAALLGEDRTAIYLVEHMLVRPTAAWGTVGPLLGKLAPAGRGCHTPWDGVDSQRGGRRSPSGRVAYNGPRSGCGQIATVGVHRPTPTGEGSPRLRPEACGGVAGALPGGLLGSILPRQRLASGSPVPGAGRLPSARDGLALRPRRPNRCPRAGPRW